MSKTKMCWTKAEICKLFKIVEEFKAENKPLLSAFEKFGKDFHRKTNSVRNFYYLQLKNFENAPALCESWGISLKIHTKAEQNFFSEKEFELSMDKLNALLQKGYSVRKACFEVASGDIKKMLRLQNKYYSTKQKVEPKKNNVMIMPSKKPILSDEEINSLFMGLVKLVKKSAEESLGQNLILEVQNANNDLRRSIKELAEKEREVKMLRKKFELLSSEKFKLKEEIKCLRSQNVELLKADHFPAKLDKLKTYVKKLGKTQPATK